MAEITIIMNPQAGTKKANKHLTDIICLFRKYNYISRVFMTANAGEAYKAAKKLASKSKIVVAIGGDGTLNEVVHGVVDSKADVPVGYIPTGSTNDFAATLNIPKDIMKAAEKIVTGKPCLLDIGTFNGKHFLYVASFGAFTKVAYSTPQSIKNMLGHLAYVLEGIKELPSLSYCHMAVETDDEVFEDDYIFGAVCNSTSLGGMIKLDPETVDLSDGLFEVMLVKYPKNLYELNQIVFSLNGNLDNCDMITFSSTKKAVFKCEAQPDWTLDGEFQAGEIITEILNFKDSFKIII